jgi:hypothetical protein
MTKGTDRFVALVTAEAPPVAKRQTRHLVASIPGESGQLVPHEELPWPKVLLIRPGQEAGYLLYRYTREGEFAGDTWHLTLDEAKEQAEFEFGDGMAPWSRVPEEVTDPVAFALRETGDS